MNMKKYLLMVCVCFMISCQSEAEKNLINNINNIKIEIDSANNNLLPLKEKLKKLEAEQLDKENCLLKLDSCIAESDSMIVKLKEELYSSRKVSGRRVIVF